MFGKRRDNNTRQGQNTPPPKPKPARTQSNKRAELRNHKKAIRRSG